MFNIPKIGSVIQLNPQMVKADEGKTPVTKIRKSNDWHTVKVEEAGMLVFFDRAPKPTDDSFRITSIIPTGTACYAELCASSN